MFAQRASSIPLGGLVSLSVLLPNLLFMICPPRDVPSAGHGGGLGMRLMEGFEHAGRLGAFALPFLCRISITSPRQM